MLYNYTLNTLLEPTSVMNLVCLASIWFDTHCVTGVNEDLATSQSTNASLTLDFNTKYEA